MKTTAEVQQEFKDLTARLNDYCDANGLPHESADELALRDGITEQQKSWLKAFIDEWDRVAEFYTIRT